MNGFLALWIPQLPLQALRWAEAAAPARSQAALPHAVVEECGPAAVRVVVAADARARSQGVENGLTEAQARLRATELFTQARDHWREQRLQRWLDGQLDSVSDRRQWLPPSRWLLHLAGLERLLGDEEVIARGLRARLRAARLRPALGVAATRSAALLAAQAAASMPGGCWILPGKEPRDIAAALGGLPLETLRGLEGCSLAAAATAKRQAKNQEQDPLFCLEIFARWGLKTLRDLAVLPRRGLAERLGEAGLGWQRWARGEDTGLLVPDRQPAEPSAAGEAFDPPLESYLQLLPWLERQCDHECRQLERRDHALGGIGVELELAAPAGARRRALGRGTEAMQGLSPRPHLAGQGQMLGPPVRRPSGARSEQSEAPGARASARTRKYVSEPERTGNEAMRRLSPRPHLAGWRWEQTFQVPHREAKRLGRQMEIALATRPPAAAIARARICFRRVAPQRIQPRLFGEAEVESERTDRLLARLRELLEDREGTRVGSAQLRDLHRRDAFTIVPFAPPPPSAAAPAPGRETGREAGWEAGASPGPNRGLCLRAFRPPPPIRLCFPLGQDRASGPPMPCPLPDLPAVAGALPLAGALCHLPRTPALRVLHASGPWRTSGEWWRDTFWSGDEWDVELSDHRLRRLLYDRRARAWFLAGEYD